VGGWRKKSYADIIYNIQYICIHRVICACSSQICRHIYRNTRSLIPIGAGHISPKIRPNSSGSTGWSVLFMVVLLNENFTTKVRKGSTKPSSHLSGKQETGSPRVLRHTLPRAFRSTLRHWNDGGCQARLHKYYVPHLMFPWSIEIPTLTLSPTYPTHNWQPLEWWTWRGPGPK